jgi:hypothetical protein
VAYVFPKDASLAAARQEGRQAGNEEPDTKEINLELDNDDDPAYVSSDAGTGDMKKLGSLLMLLGALIGVGASVWIAVGLDVAALPWLISVGLVKLAIASSLGVMGVGALLMRIANRRDERLPAGESD